MNVSEDSVLRPTPRAEIGSWNCAAPRGFTGGLWSYRDFKIRQLQQICVSRRNEAIEDTINLPERAQ